MHDIIIIISTGKRARAKERDRHKFESVLCAKRDSIVCLNLCVCVSLWVCLCVG